MTSPATIGPYRVVRSLGHGGMGEVALAYDDRLRRHVALKSVLERPDAHDSRTALVNEARAAAALSHPGIASIFDIIEERDRSYIVMEFVEGETLAVRLREGPLALPAAIDIATQLCEALDSAHAQGVIHRDLKPGNIMIGSAGRAKILDFGLAKHVTAAAPSAPTTEPSSPSLRSGMGTVGYMAPEQILGEAIDRRCDIFSLGAVLFEMFVGRRPFVDRDAVAYGVRVTTTDAPEASAVNASVSPAISAVIAKALSRKPADRFESASALCDALQTASVPGETVTLKSTKSIQIPRWSIRGAIAGLMLVAAIGAAVALIAFPRSLGIASAPEHPPVLAILPAAAQDVDPTLQSVAAGVTTLLSANLGAIAGINTVPGTAPAGSSSDPSETMRRVGATWALQTSLRPSNGTIATHIALLKNGDPAPKWEDSFSGDALTITQRALLSISNGIIQAGLLARLEPLDHQRLIAVGTSDAAAFLEYAQGRRLMSGVTTVDVLSEAVTHFDVAVHDDAGFALGWAGLAEALRRRYQQTQVPDDSGRAIDAAHRAAALEPNLAAVQVILANVFNLTGHTTDALAAVDRAIALQPSSDEAHRLRGTILMQADRTDEGVAAFERAISLRPTYYVNFESLGFFLYRSGRLQPAANAYRRVTELAPDYAGGYQGLGTALHRLGHVDEAIGHYEHAVRLGPSATAYSNLAYSYYESGRYIDAVAAYQESIKRDASRPAAHRNIGDVFARLGRQTEARAAYESAIAAGEALLKVNANDASTIALVALSEAKLGRTLAAERHAAEALAVAPKNMEVAVRNAEVYAILRQPSRAMAHLRTAIDLGYDQLTMSRNDELRPLQGEAEFKKLAARIPSTTTRE